MATINDRVGAYVNLADMTVSEAQKARAWANRRHVGIDENDVNRTKLAYSAAKSELSRELQGTREDGLSATTPYNVRHLIIASHNAAAEEEDGGDGDYIRWKNFFDVSTVGLAFTLAARVIRIAVRLALVVAVVLFFMLPSAYHPYTIAAIAVAALPYFVVLYQQATYGSKMREAALAYSADHPQAVVQGQANAQGQDAAVVAAGYEFNFIAEDFRRTFYEVEDLFATAVAGVIGVVNTVAPRAIPTNWLRDHYMARIDQMRQRNDIFNRARTLYNNERAANHRIWQQAQG